MIQKPAGGKKEDTLRDLDMTGRYEAMLVLGDESRLRMDTLERLCLEDEEPFIRKRALRMLSARKVKGFVDVLCRALADDDPMIRIIAAEHIYHAALDGERVSLCEILKPLLNDADPGVRLRSASLLIDSREKGAMGLVLGIFVEALETHKDDREIVRIASLVGQTRDSKTTRLLRRMMDRLDEKTRQRGMKTLEREGIELSRSSWF